MKKGGKIDDAQRRLNKILKNAIKNGCFLPDLVELPHAKKFFNKFSKSEKKTSKSYFSWLIVIGVVTLFTCTTNTNILHRFYTLWMKWNHGNFEIEPCILIMSDELTKVFRPPITCSMCRGVKKVEKVANISPEAFEERYAYSGSPVVITDGMTNWTAQHVFNFEFFKNIYVKRMRQWKQFNCQFFPYNTEFTHLSEVFNMSEERAYLLEGTKPWYVGWSNCDDEINQILRKHYQKPYFLPETAETKRLDWIFMGSTGYGAPMHLDNVEHPSWQAQLRGRKKWSLQPPPECYYECESIHVVVEPGEIIVLDTNLWYHSTLIVSNEISVTIGAEYD